ncbi:hypothetical protein DERF_001672 [Dermatophagoides farinae]|uniref:Uncharacterized protein n=1 Tax=Dermatophagoides farinae TaxID=6954 RepID=A0A922LD24_DERFA|nr:hypothetical protein DERF_001672 [Dermatophagoides farinae]
MDASTQPDRSNSKLGMQVYRFSATDSIFFSFLAIRIHRPKIISSTISVTMHLACWKNCIRSSEKDLK